MGSHHGKVPDFIFPRGRAVSCCHSRDEAVRNREEVVSLRLEKVKFNKNLLKNNKNILTIAIEGDNIYVRNKWKIQICEVSYEVTGR